MLVTAPSDHDPSVRFADTSPRCAQGGRLYSIA